MPDMLLPPMGPGAEVSVLAALERRRTIRDIASEPLSAPLLSALLWAAFGVNREAGPFGQAGRTAASASNSQEIDVYVALPEGAFLYEPIAHRLKAVSDQDLRRAALTPGQAQAAALAPVQMIYVVDLDRLDHTQGFEEPGLHDPEVQKAYSYVDTGLIAGNVHLFAAAEGLAAWFHNCDRPLLAKALGLSSRQRVLFAQSVGHPAETGAKA
jgi:nitroreductase